MSTLVNTSSTEISVEISVVKQKHDELLKKSLLTRSQFEGQLKEKSKVISDLKVKEGRDIDKMIEMDKQIKSNSHQRFLTYLAYCHEQSAFVLGRQILDGPLMLSEVIDWYKNGSESDPLSPFLFILDMEGSSLSPYLMSSLDRV
ncbi:hypothetical protein Tco_1213073 [Tanacetum coccineum]